MLMDVITCYIITHASPGPTPKVATERKCGIWTIRDRREDWGETREETYDGAEEREQAALCLVQLLPGICLEVKGRLARTLVRGRVELDLVLCHDLSRDISKRGRLAVLARGGEVDGREHEGVRDDGLLGGHGLDARACARAPRGSDGLCRLRRRGEGRERLLRLGVDVAVGRGRSGFDRGVFDEAWERVRSTFEFVPPLEVRLNMRRRR